jgi:hypothetical protein
MKKISGAAPSNPLLIRFHVGVLMVFRVIWCSLISNSYRDCGKISDIMLLFWSKLSKIVTRLDLAVNHQGF